MNAQLIDLTTLHQNVELAQADGWRVEVRIDLNTHGLAEGQFVLLKPGEPRRVVAHVHGLGSLKETLDMLSLMLDNVDGPEEPAA